MAVVLFALSPAGNRVAAGPNTDEPYKSMEVFSGSQAEAWRSSASELDSTIRSGLEPLAAWKESRAGAKPTLLAPSHVHLSLLRLGRIARRLKAIGEPAGVDFELRTSEYSRRLRLAAAEIAPLYGKQLEKARLTLVTKCKRHQKTLAQSDKLRETGRLDEAEKLLHSAYDDLELIGFWFPSPSDREETLAPYDSSISRLEQARVQQLNDDSIKRLALLRSQATPKFPELISQIAKAAGAVTSTGLAESDGVQMSGPEFVGYAGRRRRELQVATLRCQALDWARYAAGGKQASVALREAFEEFDAEFDTALLRVIAADASRTGAESAEIRYLQYIDALAPSLAQSDRDRDVQRYKAALQGIVELSPVLASNVLAYRAITDDALRWRKRAVDLQAKKSRKGFEPMVTPPTPVSLSAASFSVIQSVGREQLGRRLRWESLWGTPDSQVSTSAYTVGAFASVELPAELPTAVGELRAELLSEQSSPLTLEVAVALASAERGNFSEVGGELEQIELVAFLPLFVGVDDNLPGFSTVGTLPVEPVAATFEPQYQVRARMQLRPKWWKQDFLFLELP